MSFRKYISIPLAVVLILSHLTVAFSMHLCRGNVEDIVVSKLDKDACKHKQEVKKVVKTCCVSEDEKPIANNHCETPEYEDEHSCCEDQAYAEKVTDKQTVKPFELAFRDLTIVEFKLPLLIVPDHNVTTTHYLIDYVQANAPPDYIKHCQLIFYA